MGLRYGTALLCGLLWLAPGARAQDAQPQADPEVDSEQTPEGDGQSAGPDTNKGPELADLRQAFDTLLDDIVVAQGRIASLGKALFKTRLQLWVDHRADAQRLTALRLFVDGAPVYDGTGKELRTGESVQLFDGAAAPGPHELRVEYEHVDTGNGDYRYSVSQRFRLEVRQNTRTEVTIRVEDDSDIAEELPEGDEGEYDVRTRVRVDPRPMGD